MPVLVTASCPPISSARWRIDASPRPLTRGRSERPTPSSSTCSDSQVARAAEANDDPACAGVPDRVGECLGRDPVARDLHRGRQRPVHVDVHVDRGARRGHPVAPGRACRRSSPRSSSTAGRRSSVMARTSSTAVATPVAADWSRPLGDRLGDQVAGGLDLQAYAGQRGADTVVQVATEPASFLLAGGHDRGPALLEPVGEPQCGDRRGDLVADDGQQLGVAGGQARLARAGGDAEGADDLAAVPHRQAGHRPGRRTDRGERCAVRAVAEKHARPSRAAATRPPPCRPARAPR